MMLHSYLKDVGGEEGQEDDDEGEHQANILDSEIDEISIPLFVPTEHHVVISI